MLLFVVFFIHLMLLLLLLIQGWLGEGEGAGGEELGVALFV